MPASTARHLPPPSDPPLYGGSPSPVAAVAEPKLELPPRTRKRSAVAVELARGGAYWRPPPLAVSPPTRRQKHGLASECSAFSSGCLRISIAPVEVSYAMRGTCLWDCLTELLRGGGQGRFCCFMRLLLMSVELRLAIDKIAHFSCDMGLPRDFQTRWVHMLPEQFRVVRLEPWRTAIAWSLSLDSWNPNCEVTELGEKDGIIDRRCHC
uniref:PORR domain-containing protein n=1 Tax=Oryza brachyantha TaxID=4533 RepID=J3LKM7_ORYBR